MQESHPLTPVRRRPEQVLPPPPQPDQELVETHHPTSTSEHDGAVGGEQLQLLPKKYHGPLFAGMDDEGAAMQARQSKGQQNGRGFNLLKTLFPFLAPDVLSKGELQAMQRAPGGVWQPGDGDALPERAMLAASAWSEDQHLHPPPPAPTPPLPPPPAESEIATRQETLQDLQRKVSEAHMPWCAVWSSVSASGLPRDLPRKSEA